MKQELLEQFNKETGITKPVDTDLDYYQSQYVTWLEQQLVNKNDLLQRVSGMLPTDSDIETEFPVDNNWAIEDRTHAIGKRQGAKWMRDKVSRL